MQSGDITGVTGVPELTWCYNRNSVAPGYMMCLKHVIPCHTLHQQWTLPTHMPTLLHNINGWFRWQETCKSLPFPCSSSSTPPSDSGELVPLQDCELHLKGVVQALQSSAVKSMHQTAELYNVKYDALHHRVHGIGNCIQGHEHKQLLTFAQQEVLITWCCYHSHLACPLTHLQLSQKVTEVAGHALGKNWVFHFLKKHANILYSGKGPGLDPKYAQSFNPKTMLHSV